MSKKNKNKKGKFNLGKVSGGISISGNVMIDPNVVLTDAEKARMKSMEANYQTVNEPPPFYKKINIGIMP